MRLWFVTEEKHKFRIATRFVAWWQVLIFVLVSMLLLLFFFPKDSLLQNIMQQRNADKIARQYLYNLVELYPAEKSYNLLLIEQYVKFGEIIKAASSITPFLVTEPKTKADWQALLLYYKILRVKTYAKPEVSYARRKGLDEMRNIIAILKNGYFDNDDAMEIAEDAAKMEDVKTAVTIYQEVLDNSKQKCAQNCVRLYANAGRFMLSQRMYVASSKFYFLAQDHATVLDEQREYFIAALKSLQSGDMLNLAMNEASKHIGDLTDDRETLLFLSHLALAANKNKLAEKYIERVLQLKLYKSSR